MNIPNRLQRDEFRFILVKANDKIPIEKDWQNTNNYKFDDPKLLAHITNGGNYGIATGHGNLIVVDFDDESIQNKLSALLPQTFMCMSGSGLLHLYYIVDSPETLKILDDKNNTLADIQGPKKQIIAPGSIHPNGNHYIVMADRDIATITMAEIKAVFGEFIKPKTDKHKSEQHSDKYCEEIRSKLKIRDLLLEAKVSIEKNPTECPFHASKGGKCLSYGDDLWHCFHCGEGGDLFNLYMKLHGLDFPKAKKELAKRLGIQLHIVNMGGLKLSSYVDNVEMFFEQQPFFYDQAKIFWFWDFKKNKWYIIDEIDLMNSLDVRLGFVGLTINAKVKNEYLEAFRRVGRNHVPQILPKEFVQFKDKLFNIKTKDIIPADHKYFCCNPIPWDLGESEDTPTMDKLFGDWVGERYFKTLFEIMAYCCYIDYPIHLAFCLIGGGRNGKTQFQKIMFRFFGTDNVTASDLDMIMDNRFESFKLYKKLVCLMGETNFGVFDKSSVFKKVTGGDLISFEKKGKDPFNDFSYAKIIINSNSLPITEDTSEGFYRRWFIIDFPNNFPEGKDIYETIPDIEYNNLCRKIVNILPKLLDCGLFTNQGTIEERKAKYIEASNPVSLFIDLYCKRRDDLYMKSSDLYVSYTKYLKHKKRRIITRKAFSELLAEEGIITEKKNIKVGEEWVSGYYAFGVSMIDRWEEIMLNPFSNIDNGVSTRDVRDDLSVVQHPIRTGNIDSIENSSRVSRNVTKTKEEPIIDVGNTDTTYIDDKKEEKLPHGFRSKEEQLKETILQMLEAKPDRTLPVQYIIDVLKDDFAEYMIQNTIKDFNKFGDTFEVRPGEITKL